jgi:hypothetical protein
MGQDDPSKSEGTSPPRRRVKQGDRLRVSHPQPLRRSSRSTLLRELRIAAILLILVAGLIGCDLAFGPASGSVHFEGTDPMGAFSGYISAVRCSSHFEGALPYVLFSGERRNDAIGVHADPESVIILTAGGGWTLKRSECRAFDIRNSFDAEKRLHVAVLVDCTSAEGVHVQGSVRSDACYVRRPH